MPTTDAQKKATIKHMKNNLEDIRIRVPMGDKEKIKNFAENQGISMTQFIKDLIYNEMKNKQ